MEETTSNSEQIEYWNGDAGAMWTKRQDRMDALLAPISEATLRRVSGQSGRQSARRRLRLRRHDAALRRTRRHRYRRRHLEADARARPRTRRCERSRRHVHARRRRGNALRRRIRSAVLAFRRDVLRRSHRCVRESASRAARVGQAVFRLLATAETQSVDFGAVLRCATDAAAATGARTARARSVRVRRARLRHGRFSPAPASSRSRSSRLRRRW